MRIVCFEFSSYHALLSFSLKFGLKESFEKRKITPLRKWAKMEPVYSELLVSFASQNSCTYQVNSIYSELDSLNDWLIDVTLFSTTVVYMYMYCSIALNFTNGMTKEAVGLAFHFVISTLI